MPDGLTQTQLVAAYPCVDGFVWHQRVTTTATLMAKSATLPQTPQTRVLETNSPT